MAAHYTNQSTTQYAWELARDYAATHGGKAKDYFGVAMKAAQKEVWATIAAEDIDKILDMLDLQLQSVSPKMYKYVDKAEIVISSLIVGAISNAEDRGEETPHVWVRDRLANYFGGMEKIEEELKKLELAIYHGSSYSIDEEGLPKFKRVVKELETKLQAEADGKWW